MCAPAHLGLIFSGPEHIMPRQARLDPIDWATYEPYLWANEAATYGRCAVLLGSLMQLERLHQGVRGGTLKIEVKWIPELLCFRSVDVDELYFTPYLPPDGSEHPSHSASRCVRVRHPPNMVAPLCALSVKCEPI